MHEYLFHRTQHCPPSDTPPALLADDVFFHQWTTRQHPFNEIESGDRLWWVDKQTREVRWELRAVEVLKQPFNSPMEALGYLRRAYGLVPDQLNDYFESAPPSGWLLAFAIEVMQPIVGVRLPEGERLARNGLRTLTPELRAALDQAGLPVAATAPITHPSGAVNADAISAIFVPNPTRHIPSEIKATVWAQSGGVCQECVSRVDRGDIHFDHYVPFSRGGPSTVENLRVLCAPCNLSKGAKMPLRAHIQTFDEPVADLAAVLGRNQPRNIEDLLELLGEAARCNELDATRSAALTLYRDPEFADADLDRCIDVIDGTPGLVDLVTFLRLHDSEERTEGLLALMTSNDVAIRLEASIEACAAGAIVADVALPLLIEAVSGPDRYLSDLAVVTAATVPGLDPGRELPPLDSLLNSPVAVWRSAVALGEADSLFDAMVDGDATRVDQFFEHCEMALASPDAATSHEAALLFARFWSADNSDSARHRTMQYLDFAGQSDDEALLTEVHNLRQSTA